MEINPTEYFIKENMTNLNGTLAAYFQGDNLMERPLNQDREALSESLGFWLHLALERRDFVSFHEGYLLLTNFFMDDTGFIFFKIDTSGNKVYSANSIAADFRVVAALFKASDLWNNSDYQSTAMKICRFLNTYNKRDDLFVDFYDKNVKQSGNSITLSSINPIALKEMKRHGMIDVKTYIKMKDLLDRIPKQNGFYARSYNVKEKKFMYDSEINMLDQALIALHRATDGAPPDSFFSFIKNEFEHHEAIFSSYKKDGKDPAVVDQSPALYGFSILYCLKIGVRDFAYTLLNKMKQLREDCPHSPNFGAYLSHHGKTNLIDNLIPLIAEEMLTNQQLIIK